MDAGHFHNGPSQFVSSMVHMQLIVGDLINILSSLAFSAEDMRPKLLRNKVNWYWSNPADILSRTMKAKMDQCITSWMRWKQKELKMTSQSALIFEKPFTDFAYSYIQEESKQGPPATFSNLKETRLSWSEKDHCQALYFKNLIHTAQEPAQCVCAKENKIWNLPFALFKWWLYCSPVL